MKHIVIIGAGTGGVFCALKLSKRLSPKEVTITLIDPEPYHLFHPSLYEVATSPEEITPVKQLKHSVALPIGEIFKDTRVNFVQARVESLDLVKQTLSIGSKRIKYDFLVLALGSEANFYGIVGAREHAYPLKSLKDALRIRNQIAFLAQAHRQDITKKSIRIVVAGGGFAGVELAAELKGYLDFLAWENTYPREKLETLVIEGATTLLPGMPNRVLKDVYARLKTLGVEIALNSFISKVGQYLVELKSGERIAYDCLIWTAGVKAQTAPVKEAVIAEKFGRQAVGDFLQLAKHPNVFVIGDEANVRDNFGQNVPGTIPQAEHEAAYLAGIFPDLLQNRNPRPYYPKIYGYIIPLGGKFALLKTRYWYVTGYLAYVLRQLVFFGYFYKLLGFARAWRLWVLQQKLYSRND